MARRSPVSSSDASSMRAALTRDRSCSTRTRSRTSRSAWIRRRRRSMAVASETIDGKVEGKKVPASDWAWAKCSAATPFPGTPDPTQICLKNGFDPTLLYQRHLHRAGSVRARGRLRRIPRRRVVLQDRDAGRRRHAQSARRPDHLGDLARPLAVGQLPARVPALRLQRGRAGPQGARRRLADHRRRP